MNNLFRVGVALLAPLLLIASASAHQNDIHTYNDYTYTDAETGTFVRIYVQGDTRYFEANSLPDHELAPSYHNPISAQNLMLQAPATPQLAPSPTEVGLGKFGLAINGVPFEREAAEWYNRDRNSGWQYDAFGGGVDLQFDMNNAHVQPTGQYHYHGVPDALVAGDAPAEHPELVGFAADGFPIYLLYSYTNPTDANSPVVELQPSYQLKQGTRTGGPGGIYDGTFNEDWEYVAGSGDLDECNGRTGITSEFPTGTYYYVLTEAFPRVPTCWSGTPGEGWIPNPGGGQRQGGQNQQPPSGGQGQQPPQRPGGGG